MRRLLVVVGIPVAMTLISGCASSFIVRSEPAGANVEVRTGENKEAKKIGVTPLELTTTELSEKFGVQPTSGEMVEVIVSMKDYKSEIIKLPAARMGTMESVLFAKLKPGNVREEAVEKALAHMGNARTFAAQRQLERAHVEIDKALELVPRYPRAYMLRASLYFMSNKLEESMTWFEAALNEDVSLTDATKMISYLKKKGVTSASPKRVPAAENPTANNAGGNP